MKSYKQIITSILEEGIKFPPAKRQDTGSIQIPSYEFRHDVRNGFPLLTTKEINFKHIVVELLWFLRGDTNIKYLIDNQCNIWNEDAYKFYKRLIKQHVPEIAEIQIQSFGEFLDKVRVQKVSDYIPNYTYGDLGPIYGRSWRDHYGTDQIGELIENINNATKENYNDRRLIVDAWNPGQIHLMGLPPCHYGFQVILEPIVRETIIGDSRIAGHIKGEPKYYLNLKWNQRSCDTFLGIPYNIASYALLMHILAKVTNTVPKTLIGNLTCVHLYDNHIEQAKTLISREEKKLPELEINEDILWENYGEWDFDVIEPWEFKVKGYEPHAPIKAKMIS